MGLNQINENFNDAFEVYFPKRTGLGHVFYRAASLLLSKSLSLREKIFSGRRLVNERIVEYPFILQLLKPQGRVLDIGCVSSRLPIQLASLGYRVHGLDVREYPFTHKNFEFHRSDIFKWEPEEKFDIILLISVIEHFGLGDYGDLQKPEADSEGVEHISKWLVPGGQFLVSVPFGKSQVTFKHRIYDYQQLKKLFGKFEWVGEHFFQRKNDEWTPGDRHEIEQTASPDLPVNGVAILNLKQPGA